MIRGCPYMVYPYGWLVTLTIMITQGWSVGTKIDGQSHNFSYNLAALQRLQNSGCSQCPFIVFFTVYSTGTTKRCNELCGIFSNMLVKPHDRENHMCSIAAPLSTFLLPSLAIQLRASKLQKWTTFGVCWMQRRRAMWRERRAWRGVCGQTWIGPGYPWMMEYGYCLHGLRINADKIGLIVTLKSINTDPGFLFLLEH